MANDVVKDYIIFDIWASVRLHGGFLLQLRKITDFSFVIVLIYDESSGNETRT